MFGRLRRRAKIILHLLRGEHFFVHLGKILGAQAQLRALNGKAWFLEIKQIQHKTV